MRVTFLSLVDATRLGPSPALVRARLALAMVCVLFGRREVGNRILAEAEAMAGAVGDAVLRAYCLQIRSVLLVWAGDYRGSVDAALHLLEHEGHWREVSEFCLNTHNVQAIENMIGRPVVAWRAASLAERRVSAPDVARLVARLSSMGAINTLLSLGREEDARAIQRRIDAEPVPEVKGMMLYVLYGPRLRRYTEAGDFGEGFEAVVAEVEAGNNDPQRSHLIMVLEYYLPLAHARVHQYLRAESSARAALLPLVQRAVRDLARAAKIPVLKVHVTALKAYLALFAGRHKQAERLFSRAEEGGQKLQIPWVLYAVYRGRAHLLSELGLQEAAVDQARLAATIARAYQTAYRLKWIAEEFELRRSVQDSSSAVRISTDSTSDDRRLVRASSGASVVTAPLGSVMDVARAGAGVTDPKRQAATLVDDVIGALRSTRGMLYLREVQGSEPHPSGPPVLIASRDVRGGDLSEVRVDSAILDSVMSSRTTQIFFGDHGGPFAGARLIGSPLLVGREVLGAIILQREASAPEFTEEDGERLGAMAAQIPLAFELVRGLGQRDQLVQREHEVRKMEALGRLAGGVAHDLNNLFFIIQSATSTLEKVRDLPSMASNHLKLIQETTGRATELVRHLVAVSRGQRLESKVCSLNELCHSIELTLRQALGELHQLRVELGNSTPNVKVDRVQLERVLINLVANARDAMPNGGTVHVSTACRDVDELTAHMHGTPATGLFAVVSVTDTGHGMEPETLQRVFEPFFTTKRKSGGTGLGLATAWGIVNQMGGFIEVESVLGEGTTFRIHLPRTLEAVISEEDPRGSETILLVENDGDLRQSMTESLSQLGYKMLPAANINEALEVVQLQLGEIDLVITDVLLDGMNGLDLARIIRKARPDLRVLFVSGSDQGTLARRGILGGKVEFVRNPVDGPQLAQRVRTAFDEVAN